MAASCTIAIQYEDGTIRQIYCHSNGNLNGVGKILQQSYTDFDKVNDLIDLGDISVLKDSLDDTIAYHRDLHHDYKTTVACFIDDINSFLYGSVTYDYEYLFKDNKWHVLHEAFLMKICLRAAMY